MDLSIFETYDIRGKYPEQLSGDVAYDIGRAFARYLEIKQIALGRDMRISSPEIASGMIKGMVIEGVDVSDLGECTTPMLNFAVSSGGYDGGVMITASHDPKEFNGLKLISKKLGQLDAESGLLEIRQMLSGMQASSAAAGTVTEKSILPEYCDHLLGAKPEVADLKLVCDFGNGMGAVSAKPVLDALGVKTVDLFAKPDGSFPNHPANPHDIANFSDLSKKVVSERADLGVFFDGDADRALFVDELGNLVPVDLLVVLLAQEELTTKNGESIYYDLRFSKSVPDAIRAAGGKPVMMKVGNPTYKRALRERGGIMGAEFSGHIMFSDNYGIDDGLFALLKTLQLLNRRQKKLSALISGVKRYEASPEESHEARNPATVFERLISTFPSAKLVELDGAYLDFPDGFISVRQSQTEPQLFRMRVEAETVNELKKRVQKTREIILG